MKKLILLSALLTTTTLSFAQRYSDLQITLLQPVNNDTIYVDNAFTIAASIKNLGVDTIQLSDSLGLALSFDSSAIQFNFGNGPLPYMPLTNRQLLPGDSAGFSINFTVNQGWDTGSTEFCVSIEHINTVDTLIDSIMANNRSCATIYVSDPVSVNDISKDISVLVYPNPSYGVVNIQLSVLGMDFVHIELYDYTGKKVLREDKGLIGGTKNTVSLDVSTLVQGVYLYKITGEEVSTQGKLYIK